ncbi:uncharacterized protein LOC116417027 [Nasonia vitripennis]|uniref:Uncharacterized protein n=1 Tax=Nasonia vitripennis TaxID=7425 RepID=A0A7M7QDR3_NASVI|nr:uncharacterized protein LOC116417027 [Nasonia vitripennis]
METQNLQHLLSQQNLNKNHTDSTTVANTNNLSRSNDAACGQQETRQILSTSSYTGPFRLYQQRNIYAQPQANLYNYTDIPMMPPGNCLFHSLIKILDLQISPTDLRRQLRESPFLRSCGDPLFTSQILHSDTEYGDMDYLYLFSRVYNQNICVHLQYTDIRTNTETLTFCHYNVTDSLNFMHLHLQNLHFTLYITVQDVITQNIINASVYCENHGNDMSDEVCHENDIFAIPDLSIQSYTNYYKHAQGHLHFYKIFTKNTFGISYAVCDRLWWNNDLKTTSEIHNDILEKILPVMYLAQNIGTKFLFYF